MKRVPAPTRLSTSIVPPCMSTIERTMASPSPLPLPARLVRPRAAVEALEDVRQLDGVDADAGVGHLDPRPIGRAPPRRPRRTRRAA